MTIPRILSGVQPTGNLHLGNYLGAIRNWVGMQDSHQCLFMIADMHAITVPQDPTHLRQATREVAAAYIACGIDPNKSILFAQSTVPMHAELAWILNCHTPLGWLNRMTQFKEKSKISYRPNELQNYLKRYVKNYQSISNVIEDALEAIIKIKTSNNPGGLLSNHFNQERLCRISEVLEKAKAIETETKKDIKDLFNEIEDEKKNFGNARLGLLAYPVLMAADILGYHATHVPVGEDQKQHLELARDIAGAFNRAVGQEFFPLPEPMIMGPATRVMSLRDGAKKMSKSDSSDQSRIHLLDTNEQIADKIKRAKSDMLPGISRKAEDGTARPEAANLLAIYSAISGQSVESLETEFAEAQFSAFKTRLADLLIAHLTPVRAKLSILLEDTESLDDLLAAGAERANEIAAPILRQAKEMTGFLVPKASRF